ncbi:hypothetical protein CROQUDRAFT_672679 [Cronartium quercuum f. sp. fusiforme G11]|uniref:AB hydrolase-1 domain-containing protein n=1 Tax=Cronartium quercuum f. sp. fusiforme G11 TaxID=708437 RepID=A0A9P6NHU2_9BASI|nr:hypothetical protein CROQUDRAFT_672679 [Cronartium quercuum f. sp. fusiforme G11]
MPHLDLSTNVSLYYEITPSRDHNPWLLLLHPILTDATWVSSFIKQTSIQNTFNCIVFEFRFHGRSKSIDDHKIDYFTFAADIAMGMQKLKLPPVHVIASQFTATEVALRLASIFPEKILSVFACGLTPETFTASTQKALDEMYQCLVLPSEPNHWEEGIIAFQWFFFHEEVNMPRSEEIKMIDEWTGLFLKRYAPSKAAKLTLVGMLELGREKTPKEFKESIHQPFMFVHGGSSSVHTAAQAYDRFLTFTNLDPRSKYEQIPGAPLVLVPLYTSILTKKYMEWIQPILDKSLNQISSETDFKQNLKRLSEIYGQSDILNRDPTDSSNFYMIEDAMLEQRKQMLIHAKVVQAQAITLPGEGAPDSWTDATEEEKLPWK